MAVDPVPYVVHGAKHSADVFRQALSDSTGGAEGISHPSDMNVRATGTPSNQVRVAPGGLLIPNTYTGGGGQSYAGRNASETLVNVPASDSTGAKSWKIIFRVSDPQFGGQAPADPLVGPYAFIECVSASASIASPHYVLADITVPASTATITNAMITDRRSLGQPKRDSVIFARPRIADDDDDRHNYVNARWSGPNGNFYGEAFPGGAGSPNSAEIYVPEWATHQSIRADWIGVRCESGKNSYGHYWIEFGDEYKNHGWPGGRQFEYATQVFAFDTTGTQGNYRTSWPLMDQTTVPKKLRGKTIRYQFKAGLYDDADTNGVFMNRLSGLGLEVTFSQAPVNEDTL